MAGGTQAQQLDWSQEMSVLLAMPMDSLVAQSTELTTSFTPLENWTYRGYVAICEGSPRRLEALPRIDTATVPSVHKWLQPLISASDSVAFSTWRYAAPRVQGALRSAVGDLDADGFTTLETEAWVVEGTPRERQWALLRKAQWLLFVTVAAGLAALAWKQRGQQDGHESTERPSGAEQEGILTNTDIDLSQAEVEVCIGKSQPSPPEVRAAVHALEMLTLPWLEKKAMAKGTLPAVWADLTLKERQVALLLARRVPPQQIAEMLRCSPAYVYNMKSELRRKWGVADSTELDRALLRLI
jgi:DNA-binding CsgD family transcriptional regulator